jgi:hypothetical protein
MSLLEFADKAIATVHTPQKSPIQKLVLQTLVLGPASQHGLNLVKESFRNKGLVNALVRFAGTFDSDEANVKRVVQHP